mmetsp:Transcript_33294/g.88393  ORF Transcript_33294/g.88393 Transcript_33294/m.88393 type:complete len:149 (+) Transcript_33294:72-518(+)
MADQLIQEQLQEFEDTFNLFDADGDGKLSLRELGTMLNALGQNPSEESLRRMIQGFDHDDCKVDFPDWLSLMARRIKHSDTEEELIEAFKVFDRDGDGFISGDELRSSMDNLGEKLLNSEVEEMIKEADNDMDNKINFDEFVQMMKAK